jgi:sugar phosphate permease
MMISEGALPLVWLAVWHIIVYDRPRQAPWLPVAELVYLETNLALEAEDLERSEAGRSLRALLGPQVLLLASLSFLRNVADFGFLVWFPTILTNLKRFSGTTIGLLLAIPFIVGMLSMILASRHSDRSGERRLHMSFTFAVGGLFLLAGLLASQYSLAFAFVCFCLTAIGTYGYVGPFWCIPTETLPNRIVGPAMGLINGLGNLGAFVGSIAVGFIKRYTGGFVYGFGLLAIALLLAAGLCFLVNPAPARIGELAEPSLRKGA